jgi:hypothetical protein
MINQKTTSAQMTNTNSDIIITDWSDIYVINDDDLFIDFMETYGAENVKFWEEYQEQVENLDQEIVDTFLQIWTLDDVANVQDAFYGQYENPGTFAEEYYSQMYNDLPIGLVIDWEATWNYSLRHDFIFEVSTGYTGYIFDRNW